MQEDSEPEVESVGRQFGERVRVRREERGLSQRQLAEELKAFDLHLDPSAITRIERGTRDVKLAEALTISKFLQFDLDYMWSTPEELFRSDAHNLVVYATQARKTLLQALRYIDRWGNRSDEEIELAIMEQRGYKDIVDLYTSPLRDIPNFRYGGFFGQVEEFSDGDNFAIYFNETDRAIKQAVVDAVVAHVLVSEDEFDAFRKVPHQERPALLVEKRGSDDSET